MYLKEIVCGLRASQFRDYWWGFWNL